MKPQIFGKYCLLDRISVGGMAEVFRARPFNDRGYTGFLALKRILPQLAEDHEFIKMFIDEAKLTTRLHHRNIVRVHELATYKDSNFILMEYICGRDILAIQKAMRRRREICPIDFAVMMMADVARGLDFAHKATDEDGVSLKIVHRDVSPQNIIIQFDGIAKVIDFGIAKARVKSTKTRVGVVKGKVGYMSPEQVRSDPLTGQSDIFSVGVVFWELVTNKRLFKGANEFDTMHMVREADVKPPSTLNPLVPPEIDRIILKALAVDLNERYQTGADMVADLERWLQQQPTSRSKFARWMQTVFASDVEDERDRIERFRGIQSPNDVIEYNRQLTLKEQESKSAAAGEPLEDLRTDGVEITPSSDEADAEKQIAEELANYSSDAKPGDPIDEKIYMAFADERTQIRAGGFSFEDLRFDKDESEQPFVKTFGYLSDEEIPPSKVNELPKVPSRKLATSLKFEPVIPAKQRDANAGLPNYKVLIVGFIALLLIGIGVAVAAAMVLTPPADKIAPEAISSYASLVLNITPPQDIAVKLNDRLVGNVAPVTIDAIQPGKHKLEIQAKGYMTYREIISIPTTGILERSISLEPRKEQTSSIHVDIGNLGATAQISLDGKIVSLANANKGINVVPGQHVLEITENGKSSYSNLLNIKPASTINLSPVLKGSKQLITFPAGYTVEVNGEPIVGTSHLFDSEMPQRITLKKDNIITWDGYVGFPELAVEHFDPSHTPSNLKEEDFGWLAVNTKDDWWLLSINNIPIGLSSPIPSDHPIPVSKGSHTLQLSRAGATVEFPFDSQPGGTVLIDRQIGLQTKFSEVN